jgi:hypothetical protein
MGVGFGGGWGVWLGLAVRRGYGLEVVLGKGVVAVFGWKAGRWRGSGGGELCGIWRCAPPSSAASPPREGVEPPRNDRAKGVRCGGKRGGPFEAMSDASGLPVPAVVEGHRRQAGGDI